MPKRELAAKQNGENIKRETSAEEAEEAREGMEEMSEVDRDKGERLYLPEGVSSFNIVRKTTIKAKD